MDYNIVRKREKKNRNTAVIILIIAATVLIIAATILVTVTLLAKNDYNTPEEPDMMVITETEEPSIPTEEPILTSPEPVYETPAPVHETPVRRGTAEPIPDDIRDYMNGNSMQDNDNISYDDLSYLTIPHYDFNGNIVPDGHLVVNAALAEEVLDIFAELYDIQYPIERMELVDKYGADDYTSIEHNNTSAFNYRVSTDGSNRLSKHALGRAIDINPQINPYVSSDGTGSHSNAAEYWSRDYTSWSSDVARRAYIGPESEIYNIFVNKYGWEWGGSWSSYRDYQHFQKF